MCSTSQGDHGGDGFFFIKPTYLMMLSDDKIFLLQSSWISSTDQKLQSPVGCIYLDTFLHVNFPYTSILFLFSFTNTLLCSVVPLSPPLTPQLPGQEGSCTLYLAGTGCQPQRLYAAPYSTRGVAFSCFLAGLHGWVLQSLCLRCGAGMQSLGHLFQSLGLASAFSCTCCPLVMTCRILVIFSYTLPSVSASGNKAVTLLISFGYVYRLLPLMTLLSTFLWIHQGSTSRDKRFLNHECWL